MKNWKNILFITIGVVLLIICFQNLSPIRLQLLFWRAHISLVILIPLVWVVGFATGRFIRNKRS